MAYRNHYQETCCGLRVAGNDNHKFKLVLHIHPKDVEELHLADRQMWIVLPRTSEAEVPPDVRREKQRALVFMPNLGPPDYIRSPVVRLGRNGWAHWSRTVDRRLVQGFVEAAISEEATSEVPISEAISPEDVQAIYPSDVRVERHADTTALIVYPSKCLILDRSLIY